MYHKKLKQYCNLQIICYIHTLNNLIASYCNDSTDKVVSGELIASLECKIVGCFHNTQSRIFFFLKIKN